MWLMSKRESFNALASFSGFVTHPPLAAKSIDGGTGFQCSSELFGFCDLPTATPIPTFTPPPTGFNALASFSGFVTPSFGVLVGQKRLPGPQNHFLVDANPPFWPHFSKNEHLESLENRGDARFLTLISGQNMRF
jgi:hypothetical protein